MQVISTWILDKNLKEGQMGYCIKNPWILDYIIIDFREKVIVILVLRLEPIGLK